jgi:predicted MPP superfamily phosphohydrolase
LTPIATVIFTGMEIPALAAITGFTGYSWLAFLFLFLVIHGIADILLIILEFCGIKPTKNLSREILIFTLVISISTLSYGYFEAKNIEIKRLTLKTDKLPSKYKKIRIAQISDVHFSPLISTEKATEIKNLISKEKPDLIISTGDLLDRAIRNHDQVAKIMSQLQAPFGKFAITGNHEFIADLNYSINFTQKCGFKLIRNDYLVVKDSLNLVGLDDYSASRFGFIQDISEYDILKKVDVSKYTILLKHQPRTEESNYPLFDLQLSGHTHAGQIFPFTLLVKFVFNYIDGLYKLDKNTLLYVNRGTGTWGPPIRFLATPEITIIDIINKK